MDTKVTKKPHAEVLIEGVLPKDAVTKEFGPALDRYVKQVELPGFRKGKAPVERVLQEVGEGSIWRRAAEEALTDVLGDVLKEHKLIPIIPPAITLTTTEAHTDVPYSVVVVTMPVIEINNYKKVAEDALKKLDVLDRTKEKAQARASLDGQVSTMVEKKADEALTDDDAKKLGFENVAALTFFVDSEADRAVDNFDNQRKRGAVADALLANATLDIPILMIDDEARGMMESMKANIAEQGMPFNEYLEKRGMTEEQVMDEIKPQAEKRVGLDMIFAKISAEEKLKPIDEEVHRVAHAMMHQGVPDERAHQFGAETSIREQIWSVLGITAIAKPEHKHDHASHDDHDHSGHDHSKHEHKHDEHHEHDHKDYEGHDHKH